MPRYLKPTDIEIKWRTSGTGVCVIVEGETEQEDAWFYGQWFGDRAKEVTFFPQNGWTKVIEAVTTLRTTLGNKRVYGIIDRDFAPHVIYPPLPHDGILRIPRCNLENYLLDPVCWFQCIRPYTRRTPKPDWNTPEEVIATIETLYRECIPLTAYNRTLSEARNENYAAFTTLPPTDKTYKEHPKAIVEIGDVPTHLLRIETTMGLTPHYLGRRYINLITIMDGASLSSLEEFISGKYVLTLLKERLPLKISGWQAWDDILGAYIDVCPTPPEDLRNLIDLILEDAHS